MDYRIGIVGAGMIARIPADAVWLLPNARLTGVMDHGSGKGRLIVPDTLRYVRTRLKSLLTTDH